MTVDLTGHRWAQALACAALLSAGFTAASAAAAPRTRAPSVLMISIDGMKPEYVTAATDHGLNIPFLQSMMADGAYAQGVTGVWPTNTYPSHTTLLTGVAPAEHGIYNNLEFDPKRKFADSWFWYAPQVRVATLWSAAHRAGLSTASVDWPVSVGSTDVDYLIPEYWRISHPTEDLNPSDRYLIAALCRPLGMLERMQQTLGPYLMGNDTSRAADDIKTRFAIDILRTHRPRFMTLHLSSLDEVEHETGPFSDAADRALEAIDALVARLVAAVRAADPAAIVVVVSDHGFVTLTHRVNLYIPFIQAGLISASVDQGATAPSIASWRAEPWMASGMAAVMLHDPADAQTQNDVRNLLTKLRSEPAWGVAEILDAADLKQRGGFPGASFLISMRPGYYTGGNLAGDAVTPVSGRGSHGFAPENPEMRAAFFITGQGIARHRDLGQIDMRQIAPTVAGLLGIRLPNAAAAPLAVRQ